MIGLDTNIVVRYLTQDEPTQARKVNALIAGAVAQREKLHLAVVVLCELVWVLRDAYDFDKESVVGVLEKILSAAQFSIQDRDVVSEALAAYRSGAGDFADHVIGSMNRRAHCSVTITVDRALKVTPFFSVL